MAGEWRTKTLGEVCSIITDGAHQSPKTVQSGMPMASVKDLNFWGLDLDSARHISYEDYEALVRQGCKPLVGDVLIAKDGNSALDTVCVIEDPIDVVLLSSIAILRPDPDQIDSKYLKYYFMTPSVIDYLKTNFISGAAIPRVVLRDFKRAEISLPNLEEQKSIAHILATLDDKIELNRRMNETLEAIARAIFKSWFVDFDPVRAKASGETPEAICQRLGLTPDLLALFPDRLVDSELGEIPEGWEQKRVDDLMELAYGKALKASDRVDGLVPVYGSGGITGYHNAHLVDGPGIIVGRKGTVGSLYWEDRAFFPIDTVFYAVPKVELTYCYYLLQTLGLDRMNTDAAVPGLNRNNVYRLPVAWSPVELRQAFDRVAKSLRDRMFANKQESQTLENIRDTLLPKLLSGELRVPVAEVGTEATA